MVQIRRATLQEVLEKTLGSKNVYFQPPENLKLEYPCIVYQRETPAIKYADSSKYKWDQRYQVTVIDRSPDSEIPGRVANLLYSTPTNSFSVANLNHYVFTLYF